jgi:ribosomal protein S18 acetylase RimI-like enzyme
MIIAPALPKDEEVTVALWHACGLVVAYNDPVAEFRLAQGKPGSDILLGREDGMIVASVMVGHDGHRGWLYYVAVKPGHRRQGLGRQMVQAAEDWLTGHGIPRAMLLVRETNQTVIGFYEQLGFEALPRTLMRKVLAEKP